MVDRIVKEINICLENDCYISALGMALTLPDICGKAKYPQWKKQNVGLRYKKWYDEYIGFREIPSGPHSEDFSYLSGEVVYSLRNCLLHQGTPNIDNNKITEKRCKMDYFILVINKDEHIISSEFALNHDGARSDCGMKADLYSLCGKLTRAASDYYHNNKELFDFFQYQLIQ